MQKEGNELSQPNVVTVEQAQQRLGGVSRGTVYNLLKRNLLERAYIGQLIRRTLITRESVDRLAQRRKPPTSTDRETK